MWVVFTGPSGFSGCGWFSLVQADFMSGFGWSKDDGLVQVELG
jgi:hypothetical protein